MKNVELMVVDDVPESQRLVSLAQDINSDHQEVIGFAQKSLEHARQAGENLRQAKKLVGKHGDWSRWIDTNLRLPKRTAQHYMRIARCWDELVEKASASKAQGIAFLGIQKAMQLLAKPKVDLTTPYTRESTTAFESDEDSDAYPRPTLSISEESSGVRRILATEEAGDQYEVDAADPSFRSDCMSDGEVRSFHTSFVTVVHRLDALSKDAKRIPNNHELLSSIEALIDTLESACAEFRESLNRE